MRMAAGAQGVVIEASLFGKAKTVMQIAMVLALIAAGDARPLWLDLLVDATVAVTVLSGVDYFLGLRRRLGQRDEGPDRAPVDRAA